MERVDFSENSKEINDLYKKVVCGDMHTSFAVFTVNTSRVFEATSSGFGDLHAFVGNFDDGVVQFGLARIAVPGSDVFKNVLLGWCPDNAPVKLRLSFAPTFVEVAKLFAGYHIQITARDSDDLEVDEILSKVGIAAGARYSFNTKPDSETKPAYLKTVHTPIKSNSLIEDELQSIANTKHLSDLNSSSVTSSPDDGWGDEKAIEERDFDIEPLVNVPSAYCPTKVNIKELRSQKSNTISSHTQTSKHGNQADPAASEIRESTGSMDHNTGPEGKVSEKALISSAKPRVGNFVSDHRLASVERHSTYGKASFGSKPVIANYSGKKTSSGGDFQNHADENGLSPAQAWAQKRGKYHVTPLSQGSELAGEFSNLSFSHSSVNEYIAEDCQQELSTPVKISRTSERAPDETSHGEKILLRHVPESKSTTDTSDTELCSDHESEKDGESEDRVKYEDEISETTDNSHTSAEAVQAQSVELLKISAIAQYDYTKDEDNELSFEEGDVIGDIEFVDKEWWAGKNLKTGDRGVFPRSYVELNDPSAGEQADRISSTASTILIPEKAHKPNGKTAIAEYDYIKEEDNEIGFNEGDQIVDIEFVDEDWWSGKHLNSGEVGVFPGNFVALQ